MLHPDVYDRQKNLSYLQCTNDNFVYQMYIKEVYEIKVDQTIQNLFNIPILVAILANLKGESLNLSIIIESIIRLR